MGERQTILSAVSHTHTHTHTHVHTPHASVLLSVCLHLSLSLSVSIMSQDVCWVFLILFIFHVSWMFCFSAPLPHLTSDDVDKALQNSPRLMHARNTGKQPCGPAPGPAPGPAHTAYTHTHAVWNACGAAVPQLFCMCCWCWMRSHAAHTHLCLRRSQLHLPKHPRLPSRRQQRSRQSRHEFRRPALWMDSAGVCS